jgi:hypothetical protein
MDKDIELIGLESSELDLNHSDEVVIDLAKILKLAQENDISLESGKLVLEFYNDYYDGTHLERVLLRNEK